MDPALEDYVNHIKQKCRLILAISILKSKPHDLTVESYINILRSKIVDEMGLSSVCSDDFLFDDDLTQVNNPTFMINPVDNCDNNKETNNVEHDNNNENSSDNVHANNTNKLNNINKCLYNENENITDNIKPALFKDVQDANNNDILTFNDTFKLNNYINSKSESKDGSHAESFKKQTNNLEKENDSNKNANVNNSNNKITVNDVQCYDINDNGVINDNTMIVDTQESGDNVDLLQYFASYNMWNDKKNDLENTFDVLREADEKVTQTEATDNTDKTFYDSQLNVDVNKPNFKTIDPTIDSQQTEIYTVHGFTQNQYSISQSQTQMDIPQKYLYNRRDGNIKYGKKIETPDLFGQSHCNQYKNNKTISSSKNANNVKSNSKGSTQLYIKDIPANNVIQQGFKNDKDVTYQSNKADDSRKCSFHSQDNVKSKSPTTLYAKENSSNNNTEKILENIYQNEFTETNPINTNVNISNDKYNNTSDIHDINKINTQNTSITQNKFINKFIDSDVFNISNNKLKVKDTSNYSCITYLNTQEESNICSKKMHATQKDDNNKIISKITLNNNNNETKRNEDMNAQTDSKYNDGIQNTAYHNDNARCMNLDISQIIDSNDNMKTDANMINNIEKIEVDDVDSIENMEVDVEEVIPFKIVEELNKVKYFLNRNERKIGRDGYLTDSGYRSDTKYNKSLSQPCVNQSGHTLYNFLSTCPLSAQTKEISTEISSVLGNLLDQFHETENYPPFLEELLDCVKLLLKNLYQEESAEDSLLRKEELCQRILLINKSRHIQKFTIEQIANILEEIHEQFTKKDTKHDIENINSIENLCYIFSILKLILIKYVKYKDRLSQTENISQEGSLKKSSLTDIWKRKWDSNFKIQNVEQSVEKQNVLERLSGILNKLIVECMDGYSLVAYSALMCFNILQS